MKFENQKNDLKNSKNDRNEKKYLQEEKHNEDVSINFVKYDDQENELYYEEFSINSNEKYETFADLMKIEASCLQCKKIFSFRNKLHKHLKSKCKSKFVNKSSKELSHIKNSNNHVENSIIIKSIAFKIDKEYELTFKK
jgi:CRISPR/Cas system CMR subunit Cmr4 (Cas7 group RAMP superfamily)